MRLIGVFRSVLLFIRRYSQFCRRVEDYRSTPFPSSDEIGSSFRPPIRRSEIPRVFPSFTIRFGIIFRLHFPLSAPLPSNAQFGISRPRLAFLSRPRTSISGKQISARETTTENPALIFMQLVLSKNWLVWTSRFGYREGFTE